MDISVGDRVEMKKQHPCGCKTFEILRVGMDFKIKCEKCGREVMAPRAKIEKNIKKILTENSILLTKYLYLCPRLLLII